MKLESRHTLNFDTTENDTRETLVKTYAAIMAVYTLSKYPDLLVIPAVNHIATLHENSGDMQSHDFIFDGMMTSGIFAIPQLQPTGRDCDYGNEEIYRGMRFLRDVVRGNQEFLSAFSDDWNTVCCSSVLVKDESDKFWYNSSFGFNHLTSDGMDTVSLEHMALEEHKDILNTFIQHGEVSAIHNSDHTSYDNAWLVGNWVACKSCCKAIAQSQFDRVTGIEGLCFAENKWTNSIRDGFDLLERMGVEQMHVASGFQGTNGENPTSPNIIEADGFWTDVELTCSMMLFGNSVMLRSLLSGSGVEVYRQIGIPVMKNGGKYLNRFGEPV